MLKNIEAKDCLEIEMGELRSNYDQILAENNILNSKVEKLHELEGKQAWLLWILHNLMLFV